MQRMFRPLAVTAITAMAALAATCTAQAATASSLHKPDQAKVTQAAQAEAAAEARLTSASKIHSDAGIRPDTTVSLAESSTLNCDGYSGGAVAKFNDGVISYGWTSGQVYGDSWAYWYGGSPYNANSISLADTYYISGPGAGWNNPQPGSNSNLLFWNSDTLKYDMSDANVWTLHHGEYEVTWGGFPAWFSQSTAVDIYLPGVTCSPDASGTKYL